MIEPLKCTLVNSFLSQKTEYSLVLNVCNRIFDTTKFD